MHDAGINFASNDYAFFNRVFSYMSSLKERIVEFINSQDGPIRRYCHRACDYFERDQAAKENLGAVILILIGIIVPQTWLESLLTGWVLFMFMCIAATILGFVPGFIWYTFLKWSGMSKKTRGIWMLCFSSSRGPSSLSLMCYSNDVCYYVTNIPNRDKAIVVKTTKL